jgi:propionyl-CoA synthetase
VPLYEWFIDGIVNTCYNAVDRHVENGRADQLAIIYDSPVAAFKKAVIVERLPKTRSGKILRAIMVKVANGSPWTAPATIDDPDILNEIKLKLQEIDYGYSR